MMAIPSRRVATTLLFNLTFFARSASAATTQSPDCQIIGDPDVYGLGIRLSFYLQWLASLIQVFLCPEASSSTRSAAVITVSAVFINTLRNLHAESLVAVEWSMLYSVMVCLLGWNIPMTASMRNDLGRTGGSYFVLFSILAVYQLMSPYIIFHAWEYGHQPGCSVKFVFFAAIDAYSKGWTIFLKVSWILSALGLGGFYLPIATYTLVKWLASWGISDARITKLIETMDANLERDEKEDKGEMWFLRFAALFCGALGIGFLEATIKKNNITFPDTHMSDSGQLIPLLIGIFTLVVTLFDAIKACPRAFRRKDSRQIKDEETLATKESCPSYQRSS